MFADEHSLSFFLKVKKNVKCRCIDEKKSKCPKKNFQSVKMGGEMFKYRISGVRKKELKEKVRRKDFFWWKFAKFMFTG